MSTKQLLNSPNCAVDEALSGLVASHPGLRLLEGHRVVIRADIKQVLAARKVTLLSGGGSGHEPSQVGYVGSGMLSAVVAGDVFASPPSSSILAAVRAVQSPGGTLMIVTNYTGDRLTFGIALEQAKSEGIKVRMVLVGDDCAIPIGGGSIAGRRGLCGTVFVHKIAGALAEQDYSLDEITQVAEDVAKRIGTLGVCVSPCSTPGGGPSFHLGECEMELGLGVHGEAGYERTMLQCADVVVKNILDKIVSKEEGYNYFPYKTGSKVALVVNNLSSSTALELFVIANAAIKYIVNELHMIVERTFVGSFMTSLDMGGVSLTLLKLQVTGWTDCLDFPTKTPSWPKVQR